MSYLVAYTRACSLARTHGIRKAADYLASREIPFSLALKWLTRKEV